MTLNFDKYHSPLFSQARNENGHSSFGFSQMTAKGHGGACGGQFLCLGLGLASKAMSAQLKTWVIINCPKGCEN